MVAAGPEVVEMARRMGPLRYSALGDAPAVPLPAGIGRWLAGRIDTCWEQMGRPDPVVVVEQGGGAAARTLEAQPLCAQALRWLLVGALGDGAGIALEDPALVLGPRLPSDDPDEEPVTETGIGPLAAAIPDLPAGLDAAIVVAVGEVSRMATDRFEWSGGRWWEVRLAAGDDPGGLDELLVPLLRPPVTSPASAVEGARWAEPVGAGRWLAQARRVAAQGNVLVVDDLPAGWVATGPAVHPLGAAPVTVEPLGGDLSPLVAMQWTMTGR